MGDIPLDATLIASIVSSDGDVVDDWTVSGSVQDIESLEIGSSQTITVLALPDSDAEIGNHEIIVQVLDGEEVIGEARIEASVSLQNSGGGIFAILPPWLSITLSSVIIIGLAVVALRLRKTGDGLDRGEELVAPNAHVTADLSGERRKMHWISEIQLTNNPVDQFRKTKLPLLLLKVLNLFLLYRGKFQTEGHQG